MRTGQGYGYADLPALMGLMTGDEKHDPAAESTLDVLWVLYDRVLRVSPEAPGDPHRDRFLLSKGHGPMAYYAVLAAKGFLDPAALTHYAEFTSPLGHHPDGVMIPGVEIGSGSLGHGLGLAVGVALGLRADRHDYDRVGGPPLSLGEQQGSPDAVAMGSGGPSRVYCLVGDGELDEGSNHEAIAYARAAALSSLTAVVVDNSSSTHGWPGGIADRFSREGWEAHTVDGRDHEALASALLARPADRPHAVIAQIGQPS